MSFRLPGFKLKILFNSLVNSDIVALNMYKDELITINNNNTISFTPLNENVNI